MAPIEDLYNSLHTPPKEEDTPPGRNIGDFISDPQNWFRRHWGFTIYRTSYDGPASDQHWESLLADIHTRVAAEINQRTNGSPDAQSQEVLALFRLDPRSDRDRLAGLSMQQVRDLFLQEASAGEAPEDAKPMNWRPSVVAGHLFLLVDDDVMAAAGNEVPWVKCVDADERADGHRNRRVQQVFFGWMRVTTRCLAEMWEHIALFRELRRIAPVMNDDSGRGAGIYDGEDKTLDFAG